MSELQQRDSWEKAVQEAIRSLRFGSVVVVVHEGKVTQIEKREKIRPEDRTSDRAGQGNVSHQSPTQTGRPE
jgi:hypothetical protein